MNTFDRYAPFIRDFIYRNNWEELRAIQVAAADVIFNSDDNLLLTASTAQGKTEAAFFPILTLFSEDMPKSIGAIYIAPLKALINDQFSRLDELCDEAGISVFKRHGDVSQSHREKMFKNPSGILQITPESLEALLLRRHADISRLFCDLRFIVIDEVHSLLRGDRGAQTLCLIERLSRIAKVEPRRIGLSATLGDPEKVGSYLSMGTKRKTSIPIVETKGLRWRLSVEHFYVKGPEASYGKTSENIENALPVLDERTDISPTASDPGIGYIFEHTKGKKCLVFVNSREECEEVTSTLRRYCEAKNEGDRFLIHHGNISSSFRESAEEEMKDDDSYKTIVTTATLELGIDVGRLERAFQIDAPYTVSSFLQRMGRTGRRDLPPEMWFVIREDEPEMRALFPSTVPFKLLQACALIQVYLEERYVEPPRLDRKHFSLLFHQTMSTLASDGEMTPSVLASKVLTLTPFHKVTKDEYKSILTHLLKTDMIEKTENGGLIVGLTGEREISSFKFYAVFSENEEFTVRSESFELGTIVLPPPVGEKVAIAGKVWEVDDIDYKRHLVYVTEVKGSVPAYFGECAGDISTMILKRMKRVLEENTVYPYLMKNAVARLENARNTAKHSGILSESLINIGGNMFCLFPWIGTYSFLALERLIKIKCAKRLGISSFESSRPFFMMFKMKSDKNEFFEVLQSEAEALTEPLDLVYPNEIPLFDKYDEFLPAEIVRRGFAYGVLDINGMKECVKQLR